MRKNKAGAQQNGFTIMALDDDMTITDALKAHFEASGYRVDTEVSPTVALERMREKHYDILLLDFLMQPICGDEVVRRLRAFDKDVFILLLTGHKELAPPLVAMREMDIQGYYEKSDRFDQLELLVESCVKSIRQIRVIRGYRDGLGLILGAADVLHRLSPVETIMENAVRYASALALTQELFIWIHPETLMDGEPQQTLPTEGGLYKGMGHYSMPVDRFVKTILPGLSGVLSDSVSDTEPGQREGFMVAPLRNTHGAAFGFLAIDALSQAPAELKQLVAAYARQVSSALNNALMHEKLKASGEETERAYQKLNAHYLDTISTLRLLVDAKDLYTRGHSDRVSYYAVRLAGALGLGGETTERVRVAGLFHDVGKVGIADAILTKAARLSDPEVSEMRKHPERGARILAALTMFNGIAQIVIAHHEHMDGGGYPKGLAGDGIPLEARIIAIADAFDAMTSDRHYRKSLGYERASAELSRCAGTHFDTELVRAFLTLMADEYHNIQQDIAWTY